MGRPLFLLVFVATAATAQTPLSAPPDAVAAEVMTLSESGLSPEERIARVDEISARAARAPAPRPSVPLTPSALPARSIAPQDGHENVIRALHHRLASPEEIISEVDRVLSSVMDAERSRQNARRPIPHQLKGPDANAESNNPIAVILNAATGLSAEARIAEVDARDAELKSQARQRAEREQSPSPQPNSQ